jgi:glutamyl-tRNA reductase
MEIFVLGVAHHEAPVGIRERLQDPGCLGNDYVFQLHTTGLLAESLLLSTCNRLELVGYASDPPQARAAVLSRLSSKTGLPMAGLGSLLHFHQGPDAARHLFRVASGLDSQVLGETQILGQVKHAYRQAALYKTAGPVISRLFHKCFQVAKRVRSETGVASGRVSIASAAVGTADEAMAPGGIGGRRVLVLGAGEMASHLCAHLAARGPKELVILSRSLGRAKDLALRVGARALPLPRLAEALELSDVLFSAASGHGYLLSQEGLAGVLERRGGRPWWVFDLGVPRNVEPSVGDLDSVTLVNIDDFRDQVKTGLDRRRQEAERADGLLREEAAKFQGWFSALAARPTIKDLTSQAEEARRLELRKTLSRHDFTDEEAAALDTMTKALVRRLLHNPLSFVKSSNRHWRAELSLSMVRKIFGLDP